MQTPETKHMIEIMVMISNRIFLIKKDLELLAYDHDVKGSISEMQINVELCREAAKMLSEACKHLTLTGTRY